MVSPNADSIVVLAVVFDLTATVQPPVARGESREMKQQVRGKRGEGIMARFVEVSRRLPLVCRWRF
jgi:hypothetical protein